MARTEFALLVLLVAGRMRGVRLLTLVPSLSVATSSATGTGLSETAYFGFAIGRMTSISSSRDHLMGIETAVELTPPIDNTTG